MADDEVQVAEVRRRVDVNAAVIEELRAQVIGLTDRLAWVETKVSMAEGLVCSAFSETLDVLRRVAVLLPRPRSAR